MNEKNQNYFENLASLLFHFGQVYGESQDRDEVVFEIERMNAVIPSRIGQEEVWHIEIRREFK